MSPATLTCLMTFTLMVALTQCATVCTGQGSLADRMSKNLKNNDRDGDGMVTGPEIYEDFSNSYDANQDGCCSRAEWVYRWITFYRFSAGYAEKRLTDLLHGHPDEKCLIALSTYKDNNNIKLAVDPFVSGNIQSLIDFCNGDKSLYQNNCDCAQLSDVCANDHYYKTIKACVDLLLQTASEWGSRRCRDPAYRRDT